MVSVRCQIGSILDYKDINTQILGQISSTKKNMEKHFFQRLPFNRFLSKIRRLNKTAGKVSQKIVNFRLHTLMYTSNKMDGMMLGFNPGEWL